MNKIKKTIPYIINAIIVIAIFFITLKINDIHPFGNFTLAKHDAIYQYQPMLYNFITKIKEGILLNYTFNNNLGQPFIFNFLYYLSSPLNLLVMPFKNSNSMFIAIIAIKIIITSITTTFYAKKRTNNNYLSTIITISYVFSSWFLAYHYTIMWLDAFMIFPLFQYGLEELMENNKYNIYIFSLSYIMISNFYIAFIICLYTLVYYLYNIIIKKDKYINKIKNFQLIMFSTIITCLLSAFHIYATYDSFLNMGIYINDITTDTTTLPLLNLLKSIISGTSYANLLPIGETLPNIALSTIFTISLLYFFINKKISKKEKITNLLALLFIIFLFYSKTLNYIINCFHVPIGYSYRYSFIISFYLIILFIKNIKTFDNKIDKKIYFINALLLILIIIEYVFKNIEFNLFIFNIIYIIILTLLFIFYKNNKIYKFIFVTFIILEVLINTCINFNTTMWKNLGEYKFNTDYLTYRETIDYNTSFNFDLNLNLYENKNTISSFSSMQYTNTFTDIFALGCPTDNKAIISTCNNTEIFNMIFNIKTNNKYYLEKIYTANKDIYFNNLNENSIIENQSSLIYSLTGIDNIIKTIELKKNNNIFKVPSKGTYYIDTSVEDFKYLTINNTIYTFNKDNIKDDNKKEIIVLKAQYYLEIELNKNDIIELVYKSDNNNDNLTIYKLNKDKLEEAYNKLKSNQIKYTHYQDNLIEGEITVDKDQVIFTTIPYDEHWKITVDNKEVKPKIALNSLMAIDCEEGTHKIKLEYKSNYLIPTIISIITFIGLIINIIYKQLKKKNE